MKHTLGVPSLFDARGEARELVELLGGLHVVVEAEGAAARPESTADEPVGDDGEDTYLNGGPLVPADEFAA